ncbi:plasmid mobilization protein MobA [Erwinia sp. STN24]|uniref:plasmid mobilization protein MobA n=1 Tax=Erwinia sp. STN24 TaxID=3233996 RepID=UPI00351FD024
MSRSESRKTDERIQIRCTAEVKAQLTEKAQESGHSLSEYLIKSGLGKRLQSKGHYNSLAALIKITALQKHLFNESNGQYSKEFADILQEVRKAAVLVHKEIQGNDS